MIPNHGTQFLAKARSRIVTGFLDAAYKSSRIKEVGSKLKPCPQRNGQIRFLSSLSLPRNLVPENLNGDNLVKQSGPVLGRLESQAKLSYTGTNGIKVLRRAAHTETATQETLITDLRTLMRALPHSVVVITTSVTKTPSTASVTENTTPKSDSKPQYKGMTLSSFTTLTLTPSPIVTFNIRDPSRTLSALAESKSFLIHVLRADPAGARVADAFTRGNAVNPFEGFKIEEISARGDTEAGNLHGSGGVTEEVMLPKIEEEGVIRVIKCRLLQDDEGTNSGLFKIGDHVVVFGKVDCLLPGFDGAEMLEDQGLLYVNGAYYSGGVAIEPLRLT